MASYLKYFLVLASASRWKLCNLMNIRLAILPAWETQANLSPGLGPRCLYTNWPFLWKAWLYREPIVLTGTCRLGMKEISPSLADRESPVFQETRTQG